MSGYSLVVQKLSSRVSGMHFSFLPWGSYGNSSRSPSWVDVGISSGSEWEMCPSYALTKHLLCLCCKQFKACSQSDAAWFGRSACHSEEAASAVTVCIVQSSSCHTCPILLLEQISVHDSARLSFVGQKPMVMEIFWKKIPVVPTCIN